MRVAFAPKTLNYHCAVLAQIPGNGLRTGSGLSRLCVSEISLSQYARNSLDHPALSIAMRDLLVKL